MRLPNVSVIISTNGRLQSLMKAVGALEWQRYPRFELCIITGPSPDGSVEFAQRLANDGLAKTARCTVENLSVSRNLGIDLAAGDLIAFLDDDALPEPVWLEQLVPLFADPAVAGASGLVFHPNSRDIQFRYSQCDRFGKSIHIRHNHAPDAAYPYRSVYPHVMGANCMFRREMLAAIGGFDEEYDYYLDEADLCCRLIDAGRRVVHADWAPVHHKYLSGATRDEAGLTVRRQSILKNQIYFSLKNARAHASVRDIIARAEAFTDWHLRDLEGHVHAGRLPTAVLDAFTRDADAAWETGLAHGLAKGRRLRSGFAQPETFLPFPRHVDSATRHIAVIEDAEGGEAEALAAKMRLVRAFTPLPPTGKDRAGDREGAEYAVPFWRHWVSTEAEYRDMSGAAMVSTRPLSAAERGAALRRAIDRVAAFHPFDEIIDRSGAVGS